jgi:hypothetical protein
VTARRLRAAFIAATAMWAVLLLAATWLAGRAHASAIGSVVIIGVYAIGSAICHQLTERSFHLWRAQMPVCARCTGIYFGAVIGATAAALSGRAKALRHKRATPVAQGFSNATSAAMEQAVSNPTSAANMEQACSSATSAVDVAQRFSPAIGALSRRAKALRHKRGRVLHAAPHALDLTPPAPNAAPARRSAERGGGSPAWVRAALLMAVAPTLATIAFEWTTGIMPPHAIRAAAGLLIGVVVAWLVVAAADNRVN